MENALVEQPALYRCGRQLDLDGLIACRGIVAFRPGELMARCGECGAWVPITASHIRRLTVQTGAATGARDKWTVSIGRSRHSFQNALVLECGVPECHFKRPLEATRLHASGLNLMMDEHPCPQPAPKPEPEPLPEAAS